MNKISKVDSGYIKPMKKYWKCSRCGAIAETEDNETYVGMCVAPNVYRTSGICGGHFTEIEMDSYMRYLKMFNHKG